MIELDQLQRWMDGPENERIEFKEAKNQYDKHKLIRYCIALANEGGGYLVFGVSDKKPRQVVGTMAFRDLEDLKIWLLDTLHFRVQVEEMRHPEGRVVILHIPPRPIGMPLQHDGVYWMRTGESLRPMTSDELQRIFAEAGPDFSAEICSKASIFDLDGKAIDELRSMWGRKSGNKGVYLLSASQLLEDTELMVDGRITYAALILLGTRQALARHLPQAEVIFEFRLSEASGAANERIESRQGVFSFLDDLWLKVNLRNDMQHFQQGFLVLDVPTFNEAVIREAILNAVSHRDYRLGGSVFLRQYPRTLQITSPGGLPPGISVENILWRQNPRNRRIAEVFAKCGLVERSGQGMNRMFEESIKESKPLPDFSDTDDYQVSVTLRGNVQDPAFLGFLEQIGQEQLATYSTEDFLALDQIRRGQPISPRFHDRLSRLLDQGVIERIGRGRGTRYILSRRFYGHLGEKGVYTRMRGLDRETNKKLLLSHINNYRQQGSPLSELQQVLPHLSATQIQGLMRELRQEGLVHCVGKTRGARWYPGPSSADNSGIPGAGKN